MKKLANFEFWQATINRAIRTIAQTAIATIGTSAILSEIDWRYVLSASAVAGILSILNSIATGLPEVSIDVEEEIDEDEE